MPSLSGPLATSLTPGIEEKQMTVERKVVNSTTLQGTEQGSPSPFQNKPRITW
jgi:hypothetical protein